jgi:23S rRNA pseudouridine1911/1915/1917 synthase
MAEESAPVRWRVEEADEGERLDRHASGRLEVARNRVQRWIREGWVLVDGAPAKSSHPVAAGEQIECRPQPVADEADLRPEPGELRLLHEDPDLVAIDKPAGLAVHRGAGRPDGTLANRLLDRYPEIAAVGGPGRPGIVHRLDLDTTGVMVVARTALAYRRLSEAFAERRVDKRYLAIVYGAPRPAAGRIDRPLARHSRDRKRIVVRPDGRPAVTDYRTLDTDRGLAVVELTLITGRTHQIRAPLKALRHPLVGDPVYGEARWRDQPVARQKALKRFPRPALHAWRLALEHPTSGERLRITAPPAEDLEELWRRLADRDLPV